MTKASALAELRRIGPERRRLLLRSSLVLSAASAAVALRPFRVAIRFGSVPLGRDASLNPADCMWAIEAAARRLPWRTMCIEQGLAVQRILRRAGVDAILHYGARHGEPAGKLQAHVWVTVGGKPVIGGDEAAGFAEIARYPDESR